MQMLRSMRCLFAPAAVLAIALSVASADAATPQSSFLEPAVADAFKIDDGVVVSLEVDRTPQVPVTVVVPIDGSEYTLDLVPHSVRSDGFVYYVQLPDGTIEQREPAPPQTFRGSVRELQGAIVAGSILHDGLTARVEMPDGEVFWIEPLAANLPNRAADEHVVYHADDTRGHDGVCGVTQEALPEIGEGVPEDPGISSGAQLTELAVDADLEYYNRWGPDTDDVVARMELIIAIMNVQYSRDVDIIHVISAAFVRTSRTYNSWNPETLLNLFRNRWLGVEPERSTPRDVAQLFTGKFLNGAIGIAFVGGICNSIGYSVVQSDYNNNRNCATDLSAHELGHNWNALHCGCPGWTMYFQIQCANKFHASLTIPRIRNFRNSRFCLEKLQGLELPFFDDFPIEAFDVFKWSNVVGALVSSGASNPPSPSNAAQFDRTDFAESNVIDTSGVNPSASLKFSFWTEERFAEANDFFFAEYKNSSGVWTVVFMEEGDEHGNQDNFDFHEFSLPDDAKHADFQIRFRTSGSAADFWYVDDVEVSAAVSEICIVHGNPEWVREDPGTHVAFDDHAFGGYIDPKVESTNGTDLDLGKTTFNLVFNLEPFGDAGGGAITAANFSVEETGAGPAPTVVSATKSGNAVSVVLSRIITLSEWTTIVADVWSGDGVQIVDNGNEGEGVDECARLDVGFQPGDVNNSGITQPLDLNRWIVAWNAGAVHPSDVSKGIAADYTDISRNDLIQPSDLTREIAALKGQAPFTQNWRNVPMNATRP